MQEPLQYILQSCVSVRSQFESKWVYDLPYGDTIVVVDDDASIRRIRSVGAPKVTVISVDPVLLGDHFSIRRN